MLLFFFAFTSCNSKNKKITQEDSIASVVNQYQNIKSLYKPSHKGAYNGLHKTDHILAEPNITESEIMELFTEIIEKEHGGTGSFYNFTILTKNNSKLFFNRLINVTPIDDNDYEYFDYSTLVKKTTKKDFIFLNRKFISTIKDLSQSKDITLYYFQFAFTTFDRDVLVIRIHSTNKLIVISKAGAA